MAAVKLARPEELPEGFLYGNEFLSQREESELLGIFRELEFAAYDYHGYQAKRRIVRYGANYDINTREERENVPPIPEFLIDIRKRAAEFAGVTANDLVQAMVSEYSVGTPIGWHRDAPQFGIIIGISLGSACRMRLKPYASYAAGASRQGTRIRQESSSWTEARGGAHATRTRVLSLRLEPRSIYAMRGAARSEWQHSIPAVEELRYSITFRTLKSKAKPNAAA